MCSIVSALFIPIDVHQSSSNSRTPLPSPSLLPLDFICTVCICSSVHSLCVRLLIYDQFLISVGWLHWQIDWVLIRCILKQLFVNLSFSLQSFERHFQTPNTIIWHTWACALRAPIFYHRTRTHAESDREREGNRERETLIRVHV